MTVTSSHTAGMDEAVQAEGIQVLLIGQSAECAPHCPHGPTLLFVKMSRGKEQGRRFYACSACRDRKDCRFFQWADEKVSEARLQAREEYNRSCQPPMTHQQYTARFQEFIALPLAKRKFCRECQQLLLESDWQGHSGHHLLGDVSVSHMKRPSQLLHPLENKKSNAQYLFTDRSCTFILDTITSLGYTRVLCVGTPRLHEWIKLKSLEDSKPKVKSLLLDIDFRYSQFYGKDEFSHYNMFNHHFFGGEVDYDNHTLYKHGKTGRKQSPVRIFTNISPESIVLPTSEGYRFCAVCRRYVSSENNHCGICNSCPSKDGRAWKHCLLCGKCVKPSWTHCSTCDRCALENHSCGGAVEGCFQCGEKDHKRSSCPRRHVTGVHKKQQNPSKRNVKINPKKASKIPTSWKNKKKQRKNKKPAS